MTGHASGQKQKLAPAGAKLVPLAPDGGWGWVVVFGSFLVHVFSDGFVYTFGLLADPIAQEFGSNNATTAIIVSLLTGLTLASGPVASAICNKYGCRFTTILGAFISIAGCVLTYFATSIVHVFLTVGVLMGFGFGLMYCPAIVIVTMYFEKRRALATGIAVSGASVGAGLFSRINGPLIEHFGWRSVFLATLVVLVCCIVCGLTFRPLDFVLVSDAPQTGRSSVEPSPAQLVVSGTPKGKTVAGHRSSDEGEEDAALLVSESPEVGRLVRSQSHTVETFPYEDDDDDVGEVRAARSLTHIHDVEGKTEVTEAGRRSSGYLNRKDVFYTGSIQKVAEFQENPDKFRSTGSLSKTNVSTQSIGSMEIVREDDEDDDENLEGRNMSKTMGKMMSLSLLADPLFVLFAVSNLLTSVGFNSPLYFLPLHAPKIGLTNPESANVISVFGVCNMIGRIVFGLVSDYELPLPHGLGKDKPRNRLWIYSLSLTFCGVVTAMCYTFKGYLGLSVFAGLFGFSISSYVCLASVILVDLLGLDKLTNAFGVLLLWQGIGTVFGPPLSGLLADYTGTYVMSFVFCGVNLVVSGVMMFAIPGLQRKKEQGKIKDEETTQEGYAKLKSDK